MNIQAKKIELVKLILETDNPRILEAIKIMFTKELKKDYWETLSKGEKDDILGGIQEIENGDVVDYEDFMKKHR